MKLISLLYFAVVLINPFSGGSPAISEKDISIIKRGFNKNYPQLSYQLNISYPEILDENHEKHYELNLAVQKIMSAAITDFQGKLQKKGNASNFGYSYLNLDYNICRQYHGVLSVKFEKRTFYSGLKNPIDLSKTINYDVSRNRFIYISDLFRPEVDYSKELITYINSKYGCKFESPSVLNNFCIESTDLVIIIDDSEKNQNKNVCENEIRIPWKDIKELLDENNVGYELLNGAKN
ncbi:hypothetical protein [Flexithrix dorotheae]|uniref:hypothetical protein n=1 Tax=Flexithrix dorotheae TaxID=70993 RepID=UPI0003610541|nr:hypothetical protein [Flexithrix dorotheae]